MAGIDPRVRAHYDNRDDSERLFAPGFGELTRLRTWELFDRLLSKPPAVVIDIGGGPGVHSEHLATLGYAVTLVDPVPNNLELAEARSAAGVQFTVQQGDARHLPVEDESADVALLMGPLYHLPARADRRTALHEAARVLRTGGLLLAEVISRFCWVIERTNVDDLTPDRWREFDENIGSGMNAPPDLLSEGGFYAYFHRPEDAVAEVVDGGFREARAFGVECFGANLPNLAERLAADPEPILRALRMVDEEPSLLGVSPHILIAATKS